MPTVTLNGRTYDLATLIANAGYGYVGKDDRGYTLWPDAIFFDMLAELAFVKAPGATSATSLAIGTGAKAFVLNVAATMPAGLYFIYRASEQDEPVNYMFGELATSISASTAFSVTVPTGGSAGSGTYTDWIIVPATARRDPLRSFSGADTVVATDHRAVLTYTGTGHTLAFTAAATLGVGFTCSVCHDGSGNLVLDPDGAETIDGATTITLTAGQSVTVWCTGTKLLVTGAKGYGGLTLAQAQAAIHSF